MSPDDHWNTKPLNGKTQTTNGLRDKNRAGEDKKNDRLSTTVFQCFMTVSLRYGHPDNRPDVRHQKGSHVEGRCLRSEQQGLHLDCVRACTNQ